MIVLEPQLDYIVSQFKAALTYGTKRIASLSEGDKSVFAHAHLLLALVHRETGLDTTVR